MADRRETFERGHPPRHGGGQARNVTSLVVTGTMTDICVLATETAPLHRQYRMTEVEDGVATLWRW